MKKWIVLIAGTLIVSGSAQADCGTCDASKAATKKAACEIEKAGEKVPCALKTTGCKKKSAEERAVCPKRIAKEKALLEQRGACAKEAAEKKCNGTSKGVKKWYNPVSWFK